METFGTVMFCKSCNQRYNKSNRKPLVSTKCLHKACYDCVQSKLVKNEQGGIVCYQCNEISKPNKYKEDPEIVQILGSNNFIPIYCDNHPTLTCEIFCQQCDILTCSKCAKTDHQGHLLNDEYVGPEIYESYVENVIQQLRTQKLSIDTLLYKFTNAKNRDLDQKCSEFTNIYKDAKNLLSLLVSDKEELLKLDIGKYKLVEKQQPQEDGKNFEITIQESIQLDNQAKYQEFLKLVNIEVDRKKSSLLLTARIENYNELQYGLLYQGKRDGFTAQAFHEKCDDKGPTKIHQRDSGGIYNNSDYLCVFGYRFWDWDLAICNDCDKNINSSSCLGNGYTWNRYGMGETEEASSYLAGKCNFSVIEIEVYSLI
eukprot:403347216